MSDDLRLLTTIYQQAHTLMRRYSGLPDDERRRVGNLVLEEFMALMEVFEETRERLNRKT